MAEAQQTAGKQSRNGKKPIAIAKGVEVTISGQKVALKGPKGHIERTFRPEVDIAQKDGMLEIRPKASAGQSGLQFQGLTRALLANMLKGVTQGYQTSLDFRGVGYRAELTGSKFKMTVGLSHQPILESPKEVTLKVETIDQAGTKFPRVHLESVDAEILGQIAARIRSIRPPEPYNGKGVRYTTEKVREKAGKAGKTK
jgi:large subunit ribosomal protein L6